MDSSKQTKQRGAGSPAALRQANRERILNALVQRGPSSQTEVARLTGLSRATISNLIKELEAVRLVTVSSASRDGRPIREVALRSEGGLTAGVEIGLHRVAVALVDLQGRIHQRELVTVDGGQDAAAAVSRAAEIINRLGVAEGVDKRELLGIGVAIHAPLDATGAVASQSPQVGWNGVRVAETLGDLLGLKVVADNDANLAALAEITWGAGRGYGEFAFVDISWGIGAGLVLGGEIYRGSTGTAGEIGHTIVADNGPVCHCGNRGCLSAVASGWAIVTAMHALRGPDLTLPGIIESAQAGDAACQRVLGDAGTYIGLAVVNLVNLLAPQRIAVGGQLAAAGSFLLDPMRDVVSRYAVRHAAAKVDLCLSELGDDAVLLGAAALPMREARRAGQDWLLEQGSQATERSPSSSSRTGVLARAEVPVS